MLFPLRLATDLCLRAEGRKAVAEILCPSCGAENWLENQSRCLSCDAILRRCANCANYDSSKQFCRAIRAEIDSYEAGNPSVLSTSTKCQHFRLAA